MWQRASRRRKSAGACKASGRLLVATTGLQATAGGVPSGGLSRQLKPAGVPSG